MPPRDDEDREHRPPSRWEGEAPRASQAIGTEPWRRDAAHAGTSPSQEAGPRGLSGEERHAGSAAGTVYGSGRWGSLGPEAPSGYSGPSGTGYGQTCPGQSGYGQPEAGHGGAVSYAGTRGYAGYAGARHAADLPPPARGLEPARPDGYDIDYQQWRDEQMRKLDSDYQQWREARYRKFADEFNAWRSSRHDAAGTSPAPGAPAGGAGPGSTSSPAEGSAPAGTPTPSSSQPT